jgi:hypothetical protein
MKTRIRTTAVLATCIAAALTTISAHADITLEERMSVEGTGLMKMANMTGRTVTTIAGDRARTESDMQMQSRLVRAFARDGATAQIVRLDQDKVYDLNLKKKRYTESSLAEQRAEMEKARQQSQEAQASQQQSASGVDESECEWQPPQTDVKRTGETSSIAGFNAERVVITASQACKVKNSDQVCNFGLVLDQWLTPNFQGQEEVTAYQRAYAEKMGFTAAASRDFAERAEAMFGRYEDMWQELAAKMQDVKGYPVKSSIGFGLGGPQCQSQQQAQTEDPSAMPGGIAGQIGGAIGGLFNRKKNEPAPEAAPTTSAPATMPNGLTPLMTVTSELVSVSRGQVSPQLFEVPADFKLDK